ncbi:Stk1 family PASTA domain-containing Ser/Thr kinase [Metabacillus malikii]|uniref:non-specific serine/threonine protein kinase n=1 Tax=Metabacillus malikii TaxID=1504265 RepID=A0ABT9ZEA3_9BACI|nr:Stk1 family PASTA domain-containing Ser/Thr kinase [Metabacillus malikii]MDQ0230581.1 serine/threonine-protein kinase [Metabacillus malikii]
MLIGKRISGRYKILEVIGGGGMANVYLARDMILEREVAMKVLRFDFSNDDEFIKRFRREAQSATSLAHPNIVSIYDVGEEDGIYYIVMEYVDGQTLKKYIQQFAPVQPRKAVHIMLQIVAAMQHAHDNHIIHRDIKPHNILIDREGNVKVTDFGIAVALSSTTITQTNSVLGSIHYLSPEQARGGMANKKSDIYSIGIVLFELLTGRLPFDGESAISIALKHLQSSTPSVRRWNPDVPQSLENVILKSTAKDPFHRYHSIEEMERDLDTVFDVNRISEEPFTIPDDDEATKAIPIITEENVGEHKIGDTLVHTPEKKQMDVPKEDVKKHKAHKKDKPKKKKSKLAIFIITTFIILMAGAISAFTILPPLLLPKDIEVPDVTEKPYDEAVDMLKESGFTINDPVMLTDEEIEEGYVIKTEPKAAEVAKEGAPVTIYQSTGKEKITIDDYVGKTIDRVRLILEKNGIKVTIEEATSDTELEGTIISQTPEVGEEIIPSEDTITLVVSTGPKRINIENLNGKSKEEVEAYVNENGLALSEKEEFNEQIPKGHVVSQKPNPGEEVNPKETQIEVVYSLGPEEKPLLPKKLSETITIPYNPTEEGQELEVSIIIDDAERSFPNVFETFTINSPKTYTLNLTIAPGEEAFYQVTVDNKVVTSKAIPYDNE